jgi:hypothetical protein
MDASILQPTNLPNLDQLDIHFRSTRWRGNFPDGDWCQKWATEAILTYALDYVHHIPKVVIESYLKTSTKVTLAKALAQVRHDASKEPPSWIMKKNQDSDEVELNM